MAQLTRTEIANMTAQEIVAAQERGDLNDLLGIPPQNAVSRAIAGGRLNQADAQELLRAGRPDLVVEAYQDGRFPHAGAEEQHDEPEAETDETDSEPEDTTEGQ